MLQPIAARDAADRGGPARIGAGATAQAGMLGPVATLFLAFWLLAEPITGLQMAGTALVMAGIFMLSMARAPDSRPTRH